jgi:hypothetical protein
MSYIFEKGEGVEGEMRGTAMIEGKVGGWEGEVCW